MQYNIFWRKKKNRPLPLDWPGVINTSSKSFDATSEECEVLQDITVLELAASGLCKPNRVTSHWVYSAILNQCVADWVGLGQQRRKVEKEENFWVEKEWCGIPRSFCAPFHCAALPLQREITELLEFPRSGFSFGVRGAKVVAQQAWMSTLWISPSQFKKL